MWIKPIYDRTKADVDLIKLDPTNENNKGAYNFTDLNRIENNCEYIMNLLNDSGFLIEKISLVIKKDWKVTDIPTIDDINRIRNNILILKKDIVNIENIEFANTMNYTKANILEKDLEIIKNVIENSKAKIKKCNTFYCGEDSLFANESNN